MFKYDVKVGEYLVWAQARLHGREIALMKQKEKTDEEWDEINLLKRLQAGLFRVDHDYRYWFDKDVPEG